MHPTRQAAQLAPGLPGLAQIQVAELPTLKSIPAGYQQVIIRHAQDLNLLLIKEKILIPDESPNRRIVSQCPHRASVLGPIPVSNVDTALPDLQVRDAGMAAQELVLARHPQRNRAFIYLQRRNGCLSG